MEEQVGELVGERLGVEVGREIALLPSPIRDGSDHAPDQLLDRALALGSPHLPAKILRGHDVGRHLRPELGELDVPLLENNLALFIGYDRGPQIPLDLVEGM